MSNLLSTVKGLMTDSVLSKMAGVVGSDASTTKSSLMKLLPSIIGGIATKGSSKAGASSLLGMIKDNNLGGSTLNNLSSLLGGGKDTEGLMNTGAKLNDALLGSSLKSISATSGLGGESSSKLMNTATPLVMGALGKVVKDENLDADGLMGYLKNQGAAKMSAVSHATQRTEAKSGGSILRWLIPLFLLLSAAWFFLQHKNDSAAAAQEVETKAMTAEKQAATQTATHTHADGTVHQGHSHGSNSDHGSTTTTTETATQTGTQGNVMGMFVDDAGNLIKDGQVLLKKGEFTMKDGEYFDASGKSVGFLKKVGEAIGGAGKAVGGAVGDAGKAVGGAVSGAATKTADAFQNLFGGMFKRKTAGSTVAAYGLSEIVFDKESHKITSFSKNEVMGLASALKAYPDSKIQVQVNTNDGGADAKENEKLSKIRAEVVHDMLVTLGVGDKQISFKGMGTGDERVAIVVE